MDQPDRYDFDRLRGLVPSSWFKDRLASSVRVMGYRLHGASPDRFCTEPKLLDLTQVRVVFLQGAINYLDSSQLKWEVRSARTFILDTEKKLQRSEAPGGVYVLVLTPYNVDGKPADEELTEQRMSAAVGLLVVIGDYHRSSVEHIFDMILRMAGDKHAGFRKGVDVSEIRLPELSQSGIELVQRADCAIRQFPETDQNRVQLSLRWVESAAFESNMVDAFLKYWIALETIGMPDTTNIRPLIELLSKAYNLHFDTVKNYLAVGRLFGLRNRIVHGGQPAPIHERLIRYMTALYRDVLLARLGLSPAMEAVKIVMAEGHTGVDAYFHHPGPIKADMRVSGGFEDLRRRWDRYVDWHRPWPDRRVRWRVKGDVRAETTY